MRRFWQSLRTPTIFIIAYMLSTYLWCWFHHHHGPSLRQLTEDLLRAFTVAVFYFVTNYFIKRRDPNKQHA